MERQGAKQQRGKPLRRKPKELSEQPTVFDVASGSGGMLLQARQDGHSRSAAGKLPPGVSAAGFTDDPATLSLIEEQQAAEPRVRELAIRIAAQLSVPRPRQSRSRRRGVGQLSSLPYRGDSDELDLDATMEVLAEHPVPEEDDIIVRQRANERRVVVLLVDVSGSARGERIAIAAATVGALAGELARDRLGVIAFWSDAAVMLRPGDEVRPQELLDGLLRIPARGLTNVAFPLELAAGMLETASEHDARAILLSDCVHNAGPDPRPLAARLPRLDVLLEAQGESDIELGRQLAAIGRGTCRVVRSYQHVAAAVSAMFRD